MLSSALSVESSNFIDQKKPQIAIDFSNVEFHSDVDDLEDQDALVFFSDQANQNITDLLAVIEQRDHYVQSAVRALERELQQSYEALQKDPFEELLQSSLKSLINTGRNYITRTMLNQARTILVKVQEWIEYYIRKKFNLLPLKVDLGNSLAMLEARLGNSKYSLQLLDDTIKIQRQIQSETGVTLLNKCKVLSLLGRHEEANASARGALVDIAKSPQNEENQKTLVICYYNIAVEEAYLQNSEVALMNYEKSYETARDLLGEEDPLTQKVKLQFRTFQQQVIKMRESEMKHFKQFQKNKFLVKDRRLQGQEISKTRSEITLPKRKFVIKGTQKKDLLVRPQSSNVKIIIKEQKSALKKPHQIDVNPELQKPKENVTVKFHDQPVVQGAKAFSSAVPMIREQPQTYFDNSDAYQSDAPSKAVKGYVANNNENEIKLLQKSGVLRWEEDINKDLENQQFNQEKITLQSEVIIKEAWEQEDDLDEKSLNEQKQNQWSFLNQIKNYQAANPLVATTSQVRMKVISVQQEQIKVKSDKLKQQKEIITQEEQMSEVVVKVDTEQLPLQISELPLQESKPEPIKKQYTLPQEKSEANKLQLATKLEKSVTMLEMTGKESFPLEQRKGSILQSQQATRTVPAKKKKTDKTLQERQREWNDQMTKEMEQYLMNCDETQQTLFQKIQDNADKEITMTSINKKKKEQMYGALLGLEMLQERYTEQKRRLEEMEKHEQHQQKVIEVLKTKKLKFQEEYNHQIKRHHAARVMLRYFQFSKDRKFWDNHKLRNNKNYFILEEFLTVKFPQRVDIAKVNLRLQQTAKTLTATQIKAATGAKSNYAGKLKQQVSEIVYGTLAVYIDLKTHQLVFKFYGPPESVELERRRLAFYHQVELHQLEYYFGLFSESAMTQEIVKGIYTRMRQSKIIVDYTKLGLNIERSNQIVFSFSKSIFLDTLNDITQIISNIVYISETYSKIQCIDIVYFANESFSREEIKISDLPAKHPWSISSGLMMVGRIFQDEEEENHFFKLVVLKENEICVARLRSYGHVENAYNSQFHFTLECRLLNPNVLDGMVKKDLELPLYFEINFEKRFFRSRPKALRPEEMVRLQRHIRKYLAWKHLRYMIENTYYYYMNKVFTMQQYTFWLRVYKQMNKQQCWVTIESLDLKVFMNQDQKRIYGHYKVDEDSAKHLSKQENPLIFFLINQQTGKVKLLRLMIESLRNEHVIRLQSKLRRIRAKQRLRKQIEQEFRFVVKRKVVVANRLLFVRIYQSLLHLRYILDVTDLVPKKQRAIQYQQFYHAEMLVLKSYADLAPNYRHFEKLFDFLFLERTVDYTKCIAKIQKIFRTKVYIKRNKALIAYEQKLLLQKKFTFKNTLFLIQLFERITEDKLVAYVCSLTHKRHDLEYFNSTCQITKNLIESTSQEEKLQKLYDFDFINHRISQFVLDLTKVKYIQNYWLRKFTKILYRKQFDTLFSGKRSDLFYQFYWEKDQQFKTLYVESLLKKDPHGPKRFKVIRKIGKLPFLISKVDFLDMVHPVREQQFVLFSFEVNIIKRLQRWGRMQYFIKQAKKQKKQFEFLLSNKLQIEGKPYFNAIFKIKETQELKYILVALKPKNRGSREKQYFLNEKVSVLLVDEMYGMLNPSENYILRSFSTKREKLAAFRIFQQTSHRYIQATTTSSMKSKFNQTNKHSNSCFLTTILLPVTTISTVLTLTTSLKYTKNLTQFCFPYQKIYIYPYTRTKSRLGAIYLEEIKHIYSIQRIFKQIYYKYQESVSISSDIKANIKIASSVFPKYELVQKSEYQKTNENIFEGSSVNSVFQPLLIDKSSLLSKSQTFAIEIWKKQSSSMLYKDLYVGKSSFQYDDLLSTEKNDFLIQKKIIGMKEVGYLRFLQKEEISKYKFIDYIKSGYKFSLSFSIDFYEKNFASLHKIDHRKKNNYERCILQLSNFLLQYSKDQNVFFVNINLKISIYGYSAVPKPSIDGLNSNVSNCFPLTYDINDHNVNGIFEVIKTYHKALEIVRPAGPIVKYLDTFIDQLHSRLYVNARSLASEMKWEKKHLVYFILSSQENVDESECLSQMEQMEGLPITLIVINVGNIGSQKTSKFPHIHFYDLIDYIDQMSFLESKIIAEIRKDFLNFVRVTDVIPEEDEDQQQQQ